MRKIRFLFRASLMLMTVLALSACPGDSDDDIGNGGTTPSPSNFNPKYKDYIESSEFKSDYVHFIDMAVAAETYKELTFKAGFDTKTGEPFGKEEMSREDIDDIYAQMTLMAGMYDEYKESINRLVNQGILETTTPTRSIPGVQGNTRGLVGAIYGMLQFFGLCKSAGTDARKTVLGIFSQIPDAERRYLFDHMKAELHKGEYNYEKWIDNLGKGKYDDAGNEIFKDFFYTSQSTSEVPGLRAEFTERCLNLKITPNNRAYEKAVDLWGAGANFCVSVMTSAAKFPQGASAENINGLLHLNKEVAKEMAPMLVTSGTAAATNLAINLGSKDRSGTDAEKQKRKKDLEKAAEQFVENHKEKNKTTVKVKDTDTKTPATSVVVTSQTSDNVSVGIGRSNSGEVEATVPVESKDDVKVTAVDDSGDKFTKEATVEEGKTTEVVGTSNEKTLIVETEKEKEEEKTSLKIDKTKIEFGADGGSEKIAMTITGYKYYGGFVEEDDAESWLSASAKDETQCTITAKPNMEGSDRTAHVIIFATNKEDIESLSDVEYVRVTVTQDSSDKLWTRAFVQFAVGLDGICTEAKNMTDYKGQTGHHDLTLHIPASNDNEDWLDSHKESLMAPGKTTGSGRYRTFKASGKKAYNNGWEQEYEVEVQIDMQPAGSMTAQLVSGKVSVYEHGSDYFSEMSHKLDATFGKWSSCLHLEGYKEWMFYANSQYFNSEVTSIRYETKTRNYDDEHYLTWVYDSFAGGSTAIAVYLYTDYGEDWDD